MSSFQELTQGVEHWKRGELGAAKAIFEAHLKHHPDDCFGLTNLASVFRDEGDVCNALSLYEQAIEGCEPADSTWIWSNYLMTLNYDERLDTTDLLAKHVDWGKRYEGIDAPVFRNDFSNRERRLHIGFVSGDFRWHSVSFFLISLFQYLDPEQIEVTCFSDNQADDEMTGLLKQFSHSWVDSREMSDEQLLKTIRRSRVDVLVDLAGHTAFNRMEVFGRRAAPVQVSWLGYPMPTGNPQIDYWVSDARICDVSFRKTLENQPSKPLFLKAGAHAYQPPMDPTEMPLSISDIVQDGSGSVCFGCFNHRAKINNELLEVWGEILKQVENSRLVLKNRSFADARITDSILRALGEHGIDSDRIILLPRTESTREHLECYRRIDIALDTFPYNGTTTTCEALWMGVPVVSLRGDTPASKVTGALLNQMGKSAWVAEKQAQYVDIAVGLAKDVPQRTRFRKEARGVLFEKGLTDGAMFAKSWLESLRIVWERYCTKKM